MHAHYLNVRMLPVLQETSKPNRKSQRQVPKAIPSTKQAIRTAFYRNTSLFTDLLFLFITERVDSVCQNGKVFAFAIPAALNDSHQSYTCRIESRPYSGESSRLLCAASTDFHGGFQLPAVRRSPDHKHRHCMALSPQFQAAP